VKLKWFVFLVLSAITAVSPAGTSGQARLQTEGSQVDLNIRFYDKKIYHISGGSEEPVFVQVTLANRSPVSYRFKLADERIFSVDFDVRSLSNQSLPPADYIMRKRSESRNVFFREIAVEPGESFSFVEDLRHYADLRQAGSFVVQARIFPELFRTGGSSFFLESNRLNLNLIPPALPGPGGIPFDLDVETNAVLVREKLPPDEVIRYMLRARQKSQWEKFFLYIDLQAMLTRDEARERSWRNETEEGRIRMLARYKEELKNSTADNGDISLIPTDFRIENTSYNNETGAVTAVEWFSVGRLTERRRYTYRLRRKDDIWTVQYYTVEKLGTE
jgi:YD repeat-containing protein